jgi:aspartate/methionine/tyrosine aminotransferase
VNVRTARRLRGMERTLIRRIFDAAPADAINLGLGQPDLPTPDVASLAGIAGIVEGRTGYTPTAGETTLRREIASGCGAFAPGPENVLVTVGSQEAIFAAFLALLDEGDELLYPDPGYPAYAEIARMLGARPVSYPVRPDRKFRVDPDDVIGRLTPKSRLVVLCSPSNPTGAVTPRGDLLSLIGDLERRGVAWLSDEIYADFSYDGAFVSASACSGGGGGLVVSGLSKGSSMTGWRVGWVVGPVGLIRRLTIVHQYLVTCASSVSQAAAVAAFSPRGRSERRRYAEIFGRRREIMGRELRSVPGIRRVDPEGAFYYFVDVSQYGSSIELAQRLLHRQKVITIPGEAFGENAEGWLRLSFACGEDGIREGLGRIREELHGA